MDEYVATQEAQFWGLLEEPGVEFGGAETWGLMEDQVNFFPLTQGQNVSGLTGELVGETALAWLAKVPSSTGDLVDAFASTRTAKRRA